MKNEQESPLRKVKQAEPTHSAASGKLFGRTSFFCDIDARLSIQTCNIIHHKTTIMADQNQNNNKLNIELPEEVAEGVYSNLAIISHSNQEFVMDFVRLVPNVPKAKVKSRIIISPQHAKRLMKALAENIHKFEAQHGPIDESNNPPMPPMSFNTPKAQA